jgi:hypothetical protein
MYAFMSYQVAVDWTPYYTLYKYKGIHHYVCVDIFSDWSVNWVPYFTHHNHTGAHHYACIYVL